MIIDVTFEYDREWLEAINGVVDNLMSDGIHYSERDEIIRRSLPVWEEYLISKGHHGDKFNILLAEDKIQVASAIKSKWNFWGFYMAILLGLNEANGGQPCVKLKLSTAN